MGREGQGFKLAGLQRKRQFSKDFRGALHPAARSSDRHPTVGLGVMGWHSASQIKSKRGRRTLLITAGRFGRAVSGRRSFPAPGRVSEAALPGDWSPMATMLPASEPSNVRMVRRRSTVRFRKGAPSMWSFFERATGYLPLRKVPFEWHSRRCPAWLSRGVLQRWKRQSVSRVGKRYRYEGCTHASAICLMSRDPGIEDVAASWRRLS